MTRIGGWACSMDPRRDCRFVVEQHAQEQRLDRSLTLKDMERMVREGSWQHRSDGYIDVSYNDWVIRVRQAPCIISVVTPVPGR